MMSRINEKKEVAAGRKTLEVMLESPDIQNRQLIESNLYLLQCMAQNIRPYSERKVKSGPRSKSIQLRSSGSIQIGDRHKAWFFYSDKSSYRSMHIQTEEQRVSLKLIETDAPFFLSHLPEGFVWQENRSASFAVNKELGQIYFQATANRNGLRVELME